MMNKQVFDALEAGKRALEMFDFEYDGTNRDAARSVLINALREIPDNWKPSEIVKALEI